MAAISGISPASQVDPLLVSQASASTAGQAAAASSNTAAQNEDAAYVKISGQTEDGKQATAQPTTAPEQAQPAPNTAPEKGTGKGSGDNSKDSAEEQKQKAAEQEEIRKLQARDREVRAHEQAHLSALGPYKQGGASYTYQTGPDGKQYAVGGEVSVDTSAEGTPEETIRKMEIIQRAALAPADPSGADRQVAAQAAQAEAQAKAEQIKEQTEKQNGEKSGQGEKPGEAEGPETGSAAAVETAGTEGSKTNAAANVGTTPTTAEPEAAAKKSDGSAPAAKPASAPAVQNASLEGSQTPTAQARAAANKYAAALDVPTRPSPGFSGLA